MPDTDDLRTGVPLDDSLLALLPLVGRWRGTGAGVVASSGREFDYGQQIVVTHDGRPFLAYESRSWLLGADGEVLRQAWRESGFWRPGPGQDDIELVLASHTGQALVFTGTAGDQRWELETVSVRHAPSAGDVGGERRLYALRGEQLMYATDLAPGRAASGLAPGGAVSGPDLTFVPHLTASLARVSAAAAVPDPGPG